MVFWVVYLSPVVPVGDFTWWFGLSWFSLQKRSRGDTSFAYIRRERQAFHTTVIYLNKIHPWFYIDEIQTTATEALIRGLGKAAQNVELFCSCCKLRYIS